jgi:hypothetical protein
MSNAQKEDAEDMDPADHNAALQPEAARLREVLQEVVDALRGDVERHDMGLMIEEWAYKRPPFAFVSTESRRLYDALAAADALLARASAP